MKKRGKSNLDNRGMWKSVKQREENNHGEQGVKGTFRTRSERNLKNEE